MATRKKLLYWIMTLCLTAVGASAQQGSSSALNGAVTDSTGAVIPEATVVATEKGTNVSTKVVTSGAGVYTFPSLPPGTYKITASHDGFSPAAIDGVTLHVAQLLSVDLKLEIGSGVETVDVASDEQLLETGTAQISHYITSAELQTWPILASSDGERQLQEFIFDSLPGTTGNTYTGSIDGGQYFSNEIYLDGVSMGTFDTAEGAPSVDAIGDFNMQTGAMGAQYNGGGTAVSNYSVKSGTNKFHGTLYEFLQNEDLNANTYDGNQIGGGRPKNRMNNYGGTIGGPVRIPKLYNGKDRTFFFVSEERTKLENFAINGTTTMPTQAMLGGDFSAFLNPSLTGSSLPGQTSGQVAMSGGQPVLDALGRPVIYGQIYNPATERYYATAGGIDPLTGLTVLNKGLVREPFANNQVPVSQFDPVAAAYLKLKFPTNYINNHTYGNIPAFGSKATFSQNDLAFKLDENLSQAQKISFFFNTISRIRSNQSSGAWAVPGVSPLDRWHYQNNPGKIIRTNYYWEISPTITNHLGVGYQRFTNIYTTPFSNQNWGSTLGIEGVPTTGFPTITFGGGQQGLGDKNNQLGDSSLGTGTIDQNVIGIEQVFISHGKHQIQAGTEWRFYRENDLNGLAQPTFGFSNAQTDDGPNSTRFAGNAVASFLLGQLSSTSRTYYNGNFEFNRREVGTFVQDDWKVTPKLSLNIGLRWEVMGGLTEARGQMTSFDPSLPSDLKTQGGAFLAGSIKFASQLKQKGFERTDWGLILPRFGITYALNPKLVWRAGFGVNTQSPEGGPFFQGSGAPSTQGYSYTNVINTTTNPPPHGTDGSVGSLSAPYPSLPTNISLPYYKSDIDDGGYPPAYIRPDGAKVTYVENYNMGLQIDLGNKTIAELNYVGNIGKRLYAYGTDQLNQLPIEDLQKYGDALLDPLPEGSPLAPYVGFSGTLQQALAPFPQYAGGSINQYDYNIGWSRYDSMQATITRTVAKGLNVLAAYTWSKAMTNTNSNYNSGSYSPVQDVHNLKLEKAVALGIFVPQQFKLTTFYDLPFGSGRKFALHGPLDWVAGGWTVSGNGQYQSGAALQIVDSFPVNGIFATNRPNYTGARIELKQKGKINISDFTSNPQYLNPAAFTHVPTTANNGVALTVGNVPSALGNVVGPSMTLENASLQKNFALGEARSFQLRVDANNVLNRSGSGNPALDINDSNFGKIENTQYQPRTMQLSGRFTF